jgi:hypothetical protein
MSLRELFSLRFVPSLQDTDESIQRLIDETGIGQRILGLFATMSVFFFCYGLVMGSYHSALQAATAGVKLVALFALTLLICFPAFFVVQYILGSKLRLAQVLAIVLSGFVLCSAIMMSLAPVVIVFLLTGSNYYFLELLHIALFVIAGFFGMLRVVSALKYTCERKGIYPHTAVVVFRFWAVIMAFVGVQIAWNLRPFVGDRGEPFALFREYEGNFYAAVVYSVRQLTHPEQERQLSTPGDSASPTPADSLSPPKLFEGR